MYKIFIHAYINFIYNKINEKYVVICKYMECMPYYVYMKISIDISFQWVSYLEKNICINIPINVINNMWNNMVIIIN